MRADDVDLIVVSDAEEILGIGDWGVNGTDISVGKLAVYTAAAGIHPSRTIAVNLDVGTDNEALLNDPAYLGNRHARVRGERYDALIASYLKTAAEMFPNALLHFEDFGPSHARRILVENRRQYRIFNDDMQGTGAIVMAAVFSGLKVTKQTFAEQRLVVYGAFTEDVVKALCAGVERPILLPLSNPTEKIEVMPSEAIKWSDGKALISVGIPVPPVPYKGVNYEIGQANNAMLYPGLGLGVIVSGAKHVTDGMLLAAAEAVASQVNPQDEGASLLPSVNNLRASSATVAVAVAKQAVKDGVETKQPENWVQAVQDAMWQAVYE